MSDTAADDIHDLQQLYHELVTFVREQSLRQTAEATPNGGDNRYQTVSTAALRH